MRLCEGSDIFHADRWGTAYLSPDVAEADPETGREIVVRGNGTAVGGTSAVAPVYAGLLVPFKRKLGFVTPVRWSNHLAFANITAATTGIPRPHRTKCLHRLGAPIGDSIATFFEAPTMGSALAARLGDAAFMPRLQRTA